MNNLFAEIPENISRELFDELAAGDGVKIERIVSRGHTSPTEGWYDQERDEWVMVVQGEAVIAYPHKASVTLSVGDYLTIPAHEKHRVAWTAPGENTVWLAVHYKNRYSRNRTRTE